MLDLEDDRIDMEGILNHPWMQGPVPAYSDLETEFKERQQKANKALNDEREARKVQRLNNHGDQTGSHKDKVFDTCFRSVGDEDFAEPNKADIEPYEPASLNSTSYYTNMNPDAFEYILYKFLTDTKNQEALNSWKSNESKYKIKYETIQKDDTTPLYIEIKIFKTDDN